MVADSQKRSVNFPTPWEDLKGQIWLSDETFRDSLRHKLRAHSTSGFAEAACRPARRDEAEILAAVATAFEIGKDRLLARDNGPAYRAAAYLLRRAANLPLGHVAALFSVSPSRISRIQRDIERGVPDPVTGRLLAGYKVKD